MIWLLAGAVVPSLLVSWAMGFLVRRVAPRWGLVDRPGERKSHAAPTALGGGLAIWLGVVLPLAAGQAVLATWTWAEPAANGTHIETPAEAAWRADLRSLVAPHVPGLWEKSQDLWFLLGAATVLMVVGLVDDRRGLDWRLRMGLQLLLAAAVVYGRGWRLTIFMDLPLLTGVLSLFWIVGLVNSFNMLDNMDGLSAGVAAITSGFLAAVMLIAPDPATRGPQLFVAGLLLVLMGSLLGFLWHNRPPARLFMGDAGSYFIGFLLAVTTLLATFAGGNLPRHAILAPLCVLAVPLYDTVTVVWIRVRSGRSPFSADQSHFSHRLVMLGLTKRQAVLTIYLATAACGLGALLLHQVDSVGAAIILLLIACLLAVIYILETTARAKFGRAARADVPRKKQ